MNITDLIKVKRDGCALDGGMIDAFVSAVMDARTPDYQLAALLMAICINGMTDAETAALTLAMARSGDTLDLSGIPGLKADKHSTGGVSDTTTLVAVPLAAACGVRVAKMSGRGLGHTGGTVDKLESIPGFDAALSAAAMVDIVSRAGCAVTGQTGALAPADKRLYALRDVTATVDSIPLIASSVMSKKLAAGCDVIVLDVKCGEGALMRTRGEARALARLMAGIGKSAGKRVAALVTGMDEPLGRCVGNALEVEEAVRVLAAPQGCPLEKLSLVIAARMAEMALGVRRAEAEERVFEALHSGEGLRCLRRMVEAQGGDAAVIDAPEKLPKARAHMAVTAPHDGYLAAVRAEAVGLAAKALGAGRTRVEDGIDPAVGVVVHARIGDYVKAGDALFTLHINEQTRVGEALALLKGAAAFGDAPVARPPLILEEISDEDV